MCYVEWIGRINGSQNSCSKNRRLKIPWSSEVTRSDENIIIAAACGWFMSINLTVAVILWDCLRFNHLVSLTSLISIFLIDTNLCNFKKILFHFKTFQFHGPNDYWSYVEKNLRLNTKSCEDKILYLCFLCK